MAYQQPPPQQQQPMMEHQREPCPDRIVDDIGGAFAMGAVGGGIWHLVKGLKNSPSGFRLRGGIEVGGRARRCSGGMGAGEAGPMAARCRGGKRGGGVRTAARPNP